MTTGTLLKWGALSLPTELVAPCGRGFELSWRRKKKAIGTCHNSTSEWVEGPGVGPSQKVLRNFSNKIKKASKINLRSFINF